MHDRLLFDEMGGAGFACPNVEELCFTSKTMDDQTPIHDLWLLAYIAPTAKAALGAKKPTVVLRPWDPRFRKPPQVQIALGLGGGQRDGQHFRQERYCFALSAMDLAGNESEKSPAVCVDTRDKARWGSDGGGCGAGRGTSSRIAGLVGLFALGLLLGFRPRRGSRMDAGVGGCAPAGGVPARMRIG